MHLVHKEYDIAVRDNFSDHTFDPLLEFSAVFGTGYHSGEIKSEKPLVFDSIGNIAGNDPAGEPLDYGCLSNARLSYKARIVLGPPAQDLDHSADFVLSAYYRIKFPLSCELCEISAVLGKDLLVCCVRGGTAARKIVFVGRRILSDGCQRLKIELRRTDSERLDQFEGDILSLCDDRQQQMLCSYLLRVILLRQIVGNAHDLLTARRKALVIKKRKIG